jgi:hypothetical protein
LFLKGGQGISVRLIRVVAFADPEGPLLDLPATPGSVLHSRFCRAHLPCR